MSAGTLVKRYSGIICLLKFCRQPLFVRLASSAFQKSLFETPPPQIGAQGRVNPVSLLKKNRVVNTDQQTTEKNEKRTLLFLISIFTLNSPIFGCLGMLCRKIFFLFAVAVFQFSYVTGWFSVFFWAQPRNHTRH